MAKKTYKTFTLKSLFIHLKKDGKRIDIQFRRGMQVESTAKYTTSNEELQEMLEKPGAGFGRDYFLESVVEKTDEKPREPAKEPEPTEPKGDNTPVLGVESFKNLPEMKARMQALGIEFPDTNNYQSIRAAAKKAGYDFQVVKNQ